MSTKIQISFPLKREINTIDDLFELERDLSRVAGCRPEEVEVNLSSKEGLKYIELDEAQEAIRKYVTNGRADDAVDQFYSMWSKFLGGANPDMAFVYDTIKRYQRSEEDELDADTD
jgi:hypothetical protein